MKPIKKSRWTGAYKNPYGASLKRRLFNLFLYLLGFEKRRFLYSEVPDDFEYPYKEDSKIDAKSPQVMWVNHTTFWVSCRSIHFLTDPMFGMRCSPFSFIGPKRLHPPGIEIDQLPQLDFILVSHDHYDHLDKGSVLELHQKNPKTLWCVPHRLSKWFHKLGIDHVVEFHWWQTHICCDSKIRITAVPAQHFSGRKPYGFNRTLWLGYVVEFLEEGKKVYFAGDTGYNPVHFKEIGAHHHNIDLSLIPIGAYLPKLVMEADHVCPKEAILIHQDVQSKLSIASHHMTFNLAMEKPTQPAFDLYCALKEAELDMDSFCVLRPGQMRNW